MRVNPNASHYSVVNNDIYKMVGLKRDIVGFSEIERDDLLLLDKFKLLVDNELASRNTLDNLRLTGISVGVVKNGKLFFVNRGYHESDADNVMQKTEVTENSVFMIGSITKTFVGTLLAYLSEAVDPKTNKPYVALDDPINMYYKDAAPFISNGRPKWPTLEQLASHSSGFPRDFFPECNTSENKYNRHDYQLMENTLNSMNYLYEPGTQFLYSGGVGVLGEILAKAYYGAQFPDEKGFEDLLQEIICKPLGMNHTSTTPYYNSRMTRPHDNFGKPVNKFYGNVGSGAGKVFSTSAEMLLWPAMLMGNYLPDEMENFIKAASKAYVPRQLRDEGDNSCYVGLCWNIRPDRVVPTDAPYIYKQSKNKSEMFSKLFQPLANKGQRYGTLYSHRGLTYGYYSDLQMCPETNTAVVMLVNNKVEGYLGNLYRLTFDIMDWVLNADAK